MVVINWAAGAASAVLSWGGAERCRASQLAANIAELNACKASNRHSSMRNGRI